MRTRYLKGNNMTLKEWRKFKLAVLENFTLYPVHTCTRLLEISCRYLKSYTTICIIYKVLFVYCGDIKSSEYIGTVLKQYLGYNSIEEDQYLLGLDHKIATSYNMREREEIRLMTLISFLEFMEVFEHYKKFEIE